jgi:tetratricopeptide (TPR) repeat protein
MGDYFSASDMLPEAEEKYRAALAIQTNMGEKAALLTTRRGIGQIEMERGNFPEAEAELKALLPEFSHADDADDEAVTRGILADLYLRLGKMKEAEDEISKGLGLAAKSADPTIAASFAIQKARWQAKNQRSTSVENALSKVENQMRSAGYFELALEARLARAEAAAGPARKSELKAVAEEAKQHGYLLLARKAAESSAA